jgi:uncharacterized OB-fold protein
MKCPKCGRIRVQPFKKCPHCGFFLWSNVYSEMKVKVKGDRG